MANAFWGRIAAGAHPEDLAAISRAGGHASAKRAARPETDVVELVQAERLVECFEAELWSEPAPPADLQQRPWGSLRPESGSRASDFRRGLQRHPRRHRALQQTLAHAGDRGGP